MNLPPEIALPTFFGSPEILFVVGFHCPFREALGHSPSNHIPIIGDRAAAAHP